MKNALKYYYNLVITDIHQIEKNYYFNSQGFRYYILRYDNLENIKKKYENYLYIKQYKIKMHEIVLNKNDNFITIINDCSYIVLKCLYYNGQINLNDILCLSNTFVDQPKELNWSKLWQEKNDYMEYQINQLGKKYPLIRQSFSYYLGISETCIQLLNNLKSEKILLTVSHQRIKSKYTKFDLYNPLNMILDTKIRDVSEYLKEKIINKKNIYNELKYLNKIKRTSYENKLFFIRMLYPTYYFDLYEDIIKGEKNEIELNKIINNIDNYEKFIKKLYYFYRQRNWIEQIEWIEKNIT